MSLSGRALNSSDVNGAVKASAIGSSRRASAAIRRADRRPRLSRQSLSDDSMLAPSMTVHPRPGGRRRYGAGWSECDKAKQAPHGPFTILGYEWAGSFITQSRAAMTPASVQVLV